VTLGIQLQLLCIGAANLLTYSSELDVSIMTGSTTPPFPNTQSPHRSIGDDQNQVSINLLGGFDQFTWLNSTAVPRP
jgi:hypothetical protein